MKKQAEEVKKPAEIVEVVVEEEEEEEGEADEEVKAPKENKPNPILAILQNKIKDTLKKQIAIEANKFIT